MSLFPPPLSRFGLPGAGCELRTVFCDESLDLCEIDSLMVKRLLISLLSGAVAGVDGLFLFSLLLMNLVSLAAVMGLLSVPFSKLV